MDSGVSDPALIIRRVDAADIMTLQLWSPHGVASKTKADGTPVTSADGEVEDAIFRALLLILTTISSVKNLVQDQAKMQADGSRMGLMARVANLLTRRLKSC